MAELLNAAIELWGVQKHSSTLSVMRSDAGRAGVGKQHKTSAAAKESDSALDIVAGTTSLEPKLAAKVSLAISYSLFGVFNLILS